MCAKVIVLLFLIQATAGMFFVRNITTCGNPFIQFRVKVTTLKNSSQVLSGTYSSKVPNGDNMDSTLTLYLSSGTKWTQVAKLPEKRGMCFQMDKFVGPFFHDVQRSAGIMTECPLPAGTYHLGNYRPNFEKMKLQLPPGKVKVNVEVREKATKKLAMCFDLEAENVP